MPSSAIAKSWDFKQTLSALTINGDGDHAAIALGDGSLRFLSILDPKEPPKDIPLHDGVTLSLQPDTDGHSFLSGGDDGRLFIVDPALAEQTRLAEHKGRWIDHVAASIEGEWRAYATGKKIYILNADGSEKLSAELPSSAGGLAFSPNGNRLAASHYGGVSLFWTKAKETAPVRLVWKGSHLGIVWHPDGKAIITAMQESALHGWRFADNKEMQMQGYAGKIHSMGFTPKGRYLATAGADQAICWPFFGGGPWNKTPLTLGGRDGRLVTRVAPHPKDELVAVGYDDGMLILAPLDGRMEVLIHSPLADKNARVAGLMWNTAGDCLFAALENGYVMLFTLTSVRAAAHV